ncbi:LamG domain-containing protein [bacterium]|nr:LamG domain-containing protein [bacterium]
MADTTSNLLGQWLLNGDLTAEVGDAQTAHTGTVTYETSAEAPVGVQQVGVFDGSTATDTAGAFPSLDINTAQTVSAWIKTTLATGWIVAPRESSTGSIALLVSSGKLLGAAGSSNLFPISTTSVDDGEWHLLTATYDGGGSGSNVRKVYVDGVLEDTETNSVFAMVTTTVTYLGARGDSVGGLVGFFTGSIADARIYNRELSADDILGLYLEGRPPLLTKKLVLADSVTSSDLSLYATRVSTVSVGAAVNTAIFSTDTGSGGDVWFSSDQAGTLPINATLVHWDDPGSKFAFDVKIGTVSATSGASIYLHVGSKPGGYGTDAYDANTIASLPLTSDFLDLTSNSNDGTGVGGIAAGAATGPDGSLPATTFDGVGDYVDVGTLVEGGRNNTVSLWFASTPVGDPSSRHQLFGGDSTNRFTIELTSLTSVVKARIGSDGTRFGTVDAGDGWTHVALTYTDAGPSSAIYINGSLDATGSDDLAGNPASQNIGSFSSGVGAFFEGDVAGFQVASVARTLAEINADYLLQGSTAASYWTVTDASPALPAATFDLRSDREVVLSGSDVTSWGNASGGTSPSFSNDPADRILGFPAIQFVAASSEYLEWDEIASMFSGDDPDFTWAMVFMSGDVGSSSIAVGASNTADSSEAIILQSSGGTLNLRREDSLGNVSTMVSLADVADVPYLLIGKSESGTGSMLIRRLDTDAELSGSSAYDRASLTMNAGTIGARRVDGVGPALFFNGSIARIRLYNTALGGDLTGDLTGTQLGALKTEMLATAGGGLLSRLRYAISGLGLGIMK